MLIHISVYSAETKMPFAIFIDGDKLGASPGGPSGATWGSITGTLSSQVDLQSALDGKSNTGHTHAYNTLTGIPSTFPINGFVANTSTTSPNDIINASQLFSLASGVTGDFVITPKGGGAIQTQIADNALTGGNKRGLRSVDFQRTRNNANEVASGQDSFIGAGHANKATNQFSIIVGGQSNTSSGIESYIGGGNSNTASALQSIVVGGQLNNSSGSRSFVGGGTNNTANGTNSVVVGGQNNIAGTNLNSFVGGGSQNTASGARSFIGGGQLNVASGSFATVLGGRGLTLSGDNSFGYLGGNDGTKDMTISAINTAVLGNVDLWLASNDNTPRSLRFYGQYNTSGAFPNTTKYVGFRAPNSIAADVLWTLPNADGTNGQVLQTNGTGTLSWATPSGGGGGGVSATYVKDVFRNVQLGTSNWAPGYVIASIMSDGRAFVGISDSARYLLFSSSTVNGTYSQIASSGSPGTGTFIADIGPSASNVVFVRTDSATGWLRWNGSAMVAPTTTVSMGAGNVPHGIGYNGNILAISAAGATNASVYSTDGGNNWTNASNAWHQQGGSLSSTANMAVGVVGGGSTFVTLTQLNSNANNIVVCYGTITSTPTRINLPNGYLFVQVMIQTVQEWLFYSVMEQ